MAGIVTLVARTGILTLYEEFFFTRGRLVSHPLAVPLLPEFDTFRSQLDATLMAELALIGERFAANAAVEFLDADLDRLTDSIAALTLIEAKNDRGALPYAHYFATQRPSELKRPILGGQLDTMRHWPPSLQASSSAQLQEIGVRLANLVVLGDDKTKAQDAVAQNIADFRSVGSRKQCIDAFNALRKSIHGKLGETQHKTPELGTGWADSFFRQGSSAERLTIRELDRRIAAAEVELSTMKKQRDEMVVQEEALARARADAEKAQKKAELLAAKKAAAELAARVAELEEAVGEG
ncbi:hypothetical protein [Polyangium jinanense]|uniref:Uncharacterized protein n=1 Tax=Polyangium jinanense TaxID=2829994 RepID=A0A9X3X9A0_9BACT|nr:hypothetical protein [Polyangium jinanense]MDC3959489.1 hypothetical protein [Polyangium jinanense]MDC3986087.1 hypothetical protein [Polyangium jinanense]